MRLAAGWTSVVRRVENWAGARVPTCSGPSALMQVFPTHRRMSLIQLTPPGDCMVLPAGSGAGEQRESTTAVGRMSLWPRLCRGSPRVAVRAGLRLQWALEGWPEVGAGWRVGQGLCPGTGTPGHPPCPGLWPQALQALIPPDARLGSTHLSGRSRAESARAPLHEFQSQSQARFIWVGHKLCPHTGPHGLSGGRTFPPPPHLQSHAKGPRLGVCFPTPLLPSLGKSRCRLSLSFLVYKMVTVAPTTGCAEGRTELELEC